MGRGFLILALLLAVTGCSGTDRTAPDPVTPVTPADTASQPVSTRTVMLPASADVIVGLPGEAIGYPPAVQLTSGRPGGTPVVGVSVSFTFSGGRGAKYSTITDPSGKATLANLKIDSAPGQYDITATVEGVGSLTFSVVSLAGHPIATYDLVRMEDYQLPVEFSNGFSRWQVLGGQYQLLDDGTYRRGYKMRGRLGLYDRTGEIDWALPGMFITRSSGQIEFYLDTPPAGPSSGPTTPSNLLSVGTITGGVMKMAYQVLSQFSDEEYVREY